MTTTTDSDSDSSDSEDFCFYRCHECAQGFEELEDAYEHGIAKGFMHKFVVAIHPQPGDHLYTTQYKGVLEEEEKPLADAIPQLAVDLVSLPEHHGVCLGRFAEDDEVSVAHFNGCDKGVFLSGQGEVAKTLLSDFARGRKVFVMPYKGDVLPPREAVFRALWTCKKKGFNCQTFNCEHFAAWCCIGSATSRQAWYSGVFTDPVFPFGWTAAVTKDAVHFATDWFADGASDVCPCGKALEQDGTSREGWECESGHFLCQECWEQQQLAVVADARQLRRKRPQAEGASLELVSLLDLAHATTAVDSSEKATSSSSHCGKETAAVPNVKDDVGSNHQDVDTDSDLTDIEPTAASDPPPLQQPDPSVPPLDDPSLPWSDAVQPARDEQTEASPIPPLQDDEGRPQLEDMPGDDPPNDSAGSEFGDEKCHQVRAKLRFSQSHGRRSLRRSLLAEVPAVVCAETQADTATLSKLPVEPMTKAIDALAAKVARCSCTSQGSLMQTSSADFGSFLAQEPSSVLSPQTGNDNSPEQQVSILASPVDDFAGCGFEQSALLLTRPLCCPRPVCWGALRKRVKASIPAVLQDAPLKAEEVTHGISQATVESSAAASSATLSQNKNLATGDYDPEVEEEEKEEEEEEVVEDEGVVVSWMKRLSQEFSSGMAGRAKTRHRPRPSTRQARLAVSVTSNGDGVGDGQ